MSELAKLKQSLTQVANTARKTGTSLGQYDKELNKQSQTVKALIGGGAQRKDREIIQALQSASKAVKDANTALQNAAKVAQQYAASL